MRSELPPIPDGATIETAVVPGGAYWSTIVTAGATVRVVDVEGRGSGSLLLYNALQPSERYNAPDTVKIQNQVFLTEPMVLFSDLGRVMGAITADTAGCHDTLTGGTTAATNRERYGESTYFAERNDYRRNDRHNFEAALGRHGLDVRDIVMPVNLWNRVRIADDGTFEFVAEARRPGVGLDLRAEMDVLVVLSNTPHVLDPAPTYSPGSLAITVYQGPPPAPDDVCRTGTPERGRGWANTERYLASVGASR